LLDPWCSSRRGCAGLERSLRTPLFGFRTIRLSVLHKAKRKLEAFFSCGILNARFPVFRVLPKPVLAGVVVVVTLVGAFIVYGQREIIPFQTIEWGAGSGGYPQAASLVINNQSTWAEVWTRAFCSNLSPPEYCPSLPKVNFTSSTVIAVFYGASGCFGCQLINVTEVSRIGSNMFVHIQRTLADPGCGTLQEQTFPSHIVVISTKITKAIFDVRTVTYYC